MRPTVFSLFVFMIVGAVQAQQPSLTKLWETDTVVAVPESILPDPANNILYVSLVDGAPWDADGKGGVGRLSPDGKHYNGSWVTGLNAPKGMGRYGNRLYVADISDVVVIDIPNGKVIKKIPVQGESGLNDITVDISGVVYVSDSKSGKVYRIANDVPTLFMDHLDGANGLKASGKNLYTLARKQVLLADPQKNLKVICDLPNGGDGVEEVGNGDLIVSEWIGNVFYVYADGRKVQMLDRKPEKKNTADIWYDQKTKTLYVPGFFGKTITAYRVNI
jgi:YVTN family beta-propeller protein